MSELEKESCGWRRGSVAICCVDKLAVVVGLIRLNLWVLERGEVGMYSGEGMPVVM